MAMRRAKELPQEIITEILLLLPAKFIGQYKCVSKQWLNFLSDPQFIKAHHNIHAREEEGDEKLIWVSRSISGSYSLCTSTVSGSHSPRTSTFDLNHIYQFRTLAISRKLNFQNLSNNWVNIVGSCNGLVLVVNEDDNQYLINPTTLKYLAIPNFQLALPVDHSFSMSGLGYDFATDDYKVVTVSEYDHTHDDDSIFLDVFSVRKGLWRRVECLPREYQFEELDSGVLLNGALHWLATKISDGSLVILAFDLSGEKVLKLPAPTKSNLSDCLVAHRGCLCILTDVEDNRADVWTMKEYGVKESWTKFSFTEPNSLPIPSISEREEGVAWGQCGGWLVQMKDYEGWVYELRSNIKFSEPRQAVTFMESLVNPTFSNGT